jgi:hypothetical protein
MNLVFLPDLIEKPLDLRVVVSKTIYYYYYFVFFMIHTAHNVHCIMALLLSLSTRWSFAPFRRHQERRQRRRRFDLCRYLNLDAGAARLDKNKGVATLSGLDLVLGGSLREVQVTYEQWGDQTLPDERTVVIFPSFSHSSHAASNRDDPRPGWWENMIGPGKAINTSFFRVICASVLGSPFGSTSPLSIDPVTREPFRASFPQITPADMVRPMTYDLLSLIYI